MKVGKVYKGKDSKFPYIFLGYEKGLLVFSNVHGVISKCNKEDKLVDTVAIKSKKSIEHTYWELNSHLCDIKISEDGKSAIVVNVVNGEECSTYNMVVEKNSM